MKKEKSGFTLLELLVVVGILAALVALALPFYQDYVNQSKMTAAEADLMTFKKALAMYDQLEPQVYSATDLTGLIGRYLQDFRTNTTQTNPIDPWGGEYKFNVSAGAIWSAGPNRLYETVDGARTAIGDDILVTWKPDFYLASAKKLSDRDLELTFTRKVDWSILTAANITSGVILSVLPIKVVSDTVAVVTFASDLDASGGPTATVAVVNTFAAKDLRVLSESKRPDGMMPTKQVFDLLYETLFGFYSC